MTAACDTLLHVSEEAGIERFEPRAYETSNVPVVWAIDAARLQNYLVPRDCPRVTYYAGSTTTAADVQRFLGASPSVVAIETCWFERLQSARLYCYHFAPRDFECVDEWAGYFVSKVAVRPQRIEVLADPIRELLQRAELRIVPTLWPLRDAVVASSLRFSIIRMRNAQPRTDLASV